MNKKIYWETRKRILNLLFKCKILAFKGISKIHLSKNSASFGFIIVKKSIIGLIRGVIFAAILTIFDGMLLKSKKLTAIDGSTFVSVIIGCLSVAGVILGLYCANISSIYSSKYANAPEIISNEFQYDRLTQRCIRTIIDYIIFGFIIIIEILMGFPFCWGTVFATVLWSVIVIISYSIAGNRAYQLADVYNVADDSYVLLYDIINNKINRKNYSNDANFQNYFQRVSERQIKVLNEVQRFGKGLPENNTATMIQFMCNNIALVGAYWKIKRCIARDSQWFRDLNKYQKWHFTDDMEASTALRTGTSLRPKAERDYWWFENEIFSINRNCFESLCTAYDYSSLYTYLSCFDAICEIAIKNREVNFFVSQLNFLQEHIKKVIDDTKRKEDESKIFAGVVEQLSLLYLGIILESGKYVYSFDIEELISKTINILDKGKPLEKCELLRGNEQSAFYSKIITEIQIEKKRITPDWLIAQNIAKEYHVYVNILEDAIREGIDSVFKFGQYLYDKKMLFEACIIFMRFYEYESKLTRFIKIVDFKENKFSEYHIDKAFVWEEHRLGKLRETIEKWKNLIPSILLKCSSEFAIKTWEMRDEYPDFLGESFNHICDDAVEAITQNNTTQFRLDFESLSYLMLLYQEYIRTDFLKKKDMYRVEFAYYMFTSPIIEWAQIGGLAILWGEFHSSEDWWHIVDSVTTKILNNDSSPRNLAETFVEYIQNRDKFQVGTGYRDFLETEWQLKVAQAMRESEIYQIEYDLFGSRLKTNSKLLKVFCRDFGNMGFTTDPSEVYWVLCINPMLPEEKRFHTRYSWEEKMND